MKKVLFLIPLMALAVAVSAQTYKKVKVDIGFGYAIPKESGGGTKGGVTFTLEPHYRLTDAISLGLRLEGAALAHVNNLGGEDSDAKVSVLSSYCVTGEYYLGKSSFRPFVGAGLGFFKSASVTLDDDTMSGGSAPQVVPGSSDFGFFPRVGFETGHFRMSAEYNIVGSGGYFAAKIGFFFGGGKK
ncbi:porin family protein [Pedobacter sp. BS3]|uniref:outer membrane beta-barrel protein n=1 Tax=Pedobacter sp. BS3 TaxID=2567937 RepID=UPI0011ED8045|nr:outer membrane beta-barrel protein [Pedobacter sp. BS3]TZF80806.1 porin family protein [Pedobacter sp. BS3]